MAVKIENFDIDGKSYPVDSFSDEVKNLVAIRQRWADDAEQLESETLKTKVGLNAIDQQLTVLVKNELDARNAITAANDPTATATPSVDSAE